MPDTIRKSFQARRTRLSNLDNAPISHPGLVLTRYLTEQGEQEESKPKNSLSPTQTLLTRLQKAVAPEEYQKALMRWRKMQEGRQETCRTFTGTLASPLAIGLGNESALEVGLTLHHTYGMPIIPGSALKGVCRRGLKKWRDSSEASKALSEEDYKELQKALFGDMKAASYLVFWDAWYTPDAANISPFHPDTITVHHPKYYGSHGKGEQGKQEWPTDFDDPTPVPFLVIKPRTQFLFAVDAPAAWSEFVLNLLKWSLEHIGVGGKTNAGYGYFQPLLIGSEQSQSNNVKALGISGSQENWNTESEKWENVRLTLIPNTGELKVTHEGETANATGTTAQNLRAGLNEIPRGLLKQRRVLENVDVRVEKKGNAWLLVELLRVPE